jgi:ATP-dependent helicase HrpB
MLGGRGVRLAPTSGVMEPDLFVAIDVDAGGVESLVRLASEVKREWLTGLKAKHELEFDGTRVVAFKRTRIDDLIIDETAGHIGDDTEAARVLASNVSFERVKPEEGSAASQFLVRLACLKQWRPELDLPLIELRELLPELCRGCRSVEDLRQADWLGAIRAAIPWKTLQLIDREVQELFGMKETPRVAGSIKVLVHLLAPNGRPQQVTDDLASFWANTYSIVRKELRGRYPKHDWPEDPSTAIASKGVRRV